MAAHEDSAGGARATVAARICFVCCALTLVPHVLWAYLVEDEAFSRLYVLPATLAFVAFTQYFAMAGHRPLPWERRPKTWLALGAGFLALLPLLAVLTFVSVPLVFLACYGIARLLRLDRLPDVLWARPAQWVAAALLWLLLFPAINSLTLLIGPYRQFFPPVLAAHALIGINEDGFRSPRIPVERTPGKKRIVFLGDSSTFGFPYGYDDAFPYLVAQRLAATEVGEIEFINAGIIGHSLVQIAAKLDRYLAYRPDCVVAMVGYHHQNSGRDADAIEAVAPGEHPGAGLKPHFHPPLLLPLLLLSAETSPLKACIDSRSDDPPPDSLPLFLETLDTVMDRFREAGVCVLLLEYPSPQIPAEVHDALRDAAEARGESWVPLLHLFDGQDDYAMGDEVHPDLEHHLLIADEVTRVLRERLAQR